MQIGVRDSDLTTLKRQETPKQMSVRKSLAALTLSMLLIGTPGYSNSTVNPYIESGTEKLDIGDYKGALKDFNQAVELSPNLAIAYYKRGTARSYLQMYTEALSDFNKALHINPNYWHVKSQPNL